jgi:hypothetical protein
MNRWFHHRHYDRKRHDRKRHTRRLWFERCEQRTVLAATPLSEWVASLGVDLDSLLASSPTSIEGTASEATVTQSAALDPLAGAASTEVSASTEGADPAAMAGTETPPPFVPGEGGYANLDYRVDQGSVVATSGYFQHYETSRFGVMSADTNLDVLVWPFAVDAPIAGHRLVEDGGLPARNLSGALVDELREFSADQLPDKVIQAPTSGEFEADAGVVYGSASGDFDDLPTDARSDTLESSPPIIYQTETLAVDADTLVAGRPPAGEGGFVNLVAMKSIETSNRSAAEFRSQALVAHISLPDRPPFVKPPSHASSEPTAQPLDSLIKNAAAWTIEVAPTRGVSLAFDVADVVPATAHHRAATLTNVEPPPDVPASPSPNDTSAAELSDEMPQSAATAEADTLTAVHDRAENEDIPYFTAVAPLLVLASGTALVKDRWQKLQPRRKPIAK